MKNKSIWLDNISKEKFSILKENQECDVLIIGGGITGLSCAYFLKDSNKKTILVEGNKLCHGTTSKSTGKLTYLQGDLLDKIKNVHDNDIYYKYLDSQREAIKLAKKIIIDNDIKCNLEPVNSYIFTSKTNKKNNIIKNYKLLKKKTNSRLKNNLPIKLKTKIAIEANDTFVFHPVKFVLELAEIVKNKIDIYEGTRIIGIDRKDDYLIAHTKNANIKAKQIVLACHYPFFIYPYFFPFKTTIEKSFIVASQVNDTKSFSAINVDKDVISLRYHKDRKKYLLLVSESKSLINNIDDTKRSDEVIWKMRTKFSPDIKYAWSNHDIMTSDHLPLIGEIQKNLFLATGFNTWGMTNGILAGKIISDLILKNDNEYKELFNPLRTEKNIPKIVTSNIKNGYSFINTKLDRNRNFYDKNVKIIKENGIFYGIYIDVNGKEHKVLNKCPHMKCSLSFNYQTKTWDCPCHGSSFDIDGNVINGPSCHSIKIKK